MTAQQKVVRRYLSPGECGQTARERKLRLRPSHLRFGLTVLFVALAFLGRSFEPSPTSVVHAAPLAELVLYDDAFQNSYSASSWNSPQADPLYTANVFEGSFALRKNLFINGGSGEFMAIHSAAGFNTTDYTHIEFYARSISPDAAKVRVKFAKRPWEGTGEEVLIDIPTGQWTYFLIQFEDFGATVLNRQFEGIAFKGGGPDAPFNDSDNDVVFDNIKLVRLADTRPPRLLAAQAVGSTLVRATFSEKIDPSNATSTVNYVVSSTMDANYLTGQNPASAQLLPSGREVELILPDGLSHRNVYSLNVSNIQDLTGNTVLPDSTLDFAFSTFDQFPLEWLHVEGNRIVNESGDTVILRGVNIENREWVWGSTQSINYERRAIPIATGAPSVGWGGNVILLAFASGPVNRAEQVYLDAIDELVALAKANGAYTLLVWRYSEPDVGQPSMPDQAAEDALASLAARYVNEPAVLYGLQVEPHDVSWSQLKPRLTSMIDAIRAGNPKALIAVPGTFWSRDIYYALTDPILRDNLIYKTHPYDSWSTIQNSYQLKEVAALHPVILGEFGDGSFMSLDDVRNLLDFAEGEGISWVAWLFNDVGCPCLLSDTDMFATTQYGEEIKARLQAALSSPTPTPMPIPTPVPDTTPPVLSNLSPSGVLAGGTTQATLALSTDENAICRFGATPGVDYASLPNTFTSTGGTSHSAAVSGLQDSRSYVYYMRCQDSSGSANSVDSTISFSVDSASTALNPHEWPAKVDLAVGESYAYTLRDGSQRALKLVSYNIVIPKHKIEATVQISGNGRTQTHTLQVTFAGVPVSINGLRVYGYAWKEANTGFEQVWPTGDFPLAAGKDVGFAVSDAGYTMFPDMDSYTYPADIAFHEGRDITTFLAQGDAWAHSGYDFGIHTTAPLVAMFDGWAWNKKWADDQGGIWLTKTNDEFGAQETWVWAHVKDGAMLVPFGTFVTKGTVLGYPWSNGPEPYHFHMGSRDSIDFGSWLFAAEIWNYEHQADFPAPRYWLALGPYSGGMADSYIYSDESGDIPESILPRKGDTVGVKTWKLGDNFVNSVVRIGEVLSTAPFSGNSDRLGTDSVGYVATYIYSPDDHTADSQVWLKWGSSNGAKVWLNGKSVVDKPTNPRYDTYDVVSQSPIVIDESAVPLLLKKGWNTFIAKTNHGDRNSTVWLFSPKIGDINGNRIPGLRFSARDIDLQATSVGPNSIGVAWSQPDFQGTHVETYKLDVSLDAGFNSLVKADLDMGKVTSYNITGLSGGLEYYIRVKPYNYSEMGGSVYWQHSDVVSAKTTGKENVPFSQAPPGGLSTSDVPLFVTFGIDDNWKAAGVDWYVNSLFAGRTNPSGTGNPATYDGTPARGIFNVMGEVENRGPQLEAALSNAYLQGHEIANHAYYGDDGGLGSQAAWRDSITRTNTVLTRPVGGDGTIVKGPGGDDRIATGVGVPRSEIYGFRAPHDGYDQYLFPVMQEEGFTYHSSTNQGHTSQSVDGSTDLWWPGTLDNGIPYANLAAGVGDTGPSPGMWELPQNFMWRPPELGGGVVLPCDKDWDWAYRDAAGYDAESRSVAITTILKHNLDLRLQGNRAPFHLCLHGQDWGLADWEQSAEQIANMAFKQAILIDFLDYALSKPEVRVVRGIDVINWMRNPVPLAGSSDTTPPSMPTGLTATPVSESKIDLAWTAASDPESGIAGYNVYRGGANIGTATGTAFSDTGLSQGTSHSYEVSATNGAGLEGPRSSPVAAITLSTSNNPPVTPRWAFEPWVWEDNTNTQASTQKLVDGYRSRNIPVGAVIVDSPWETNYNTFVWDSIRYPQPQQMIDSFHANGVRVLTWITGFENQGSPDYDFVKAQGFAVDGGLDFDWWKGTGVHIDFTNPDATAWWHTKMDKLLNIGIDGWKVDESPGSLGELVDTSIGSISRQEFEKYYYGDFFDYTVSQNPEGAVLARPFTRGTIHAPINKLSIGWPGDDPGDWGGLNRQLSVIYDSAEAGYGAFGAEIGGYSCCTEPGKNLLIRWAQLGAMTPLMENGGTNGGESAHLPWFHDQETVDIYRYFATLHTELVPYLFSYGVEAHLRGTSIIRNPDKTNKQHKLGEEIFVSVLDSDTTQKTVVFPSDGDWIDYWDHSRVYPGGTSTVYDAPLNRYPIFIKAGAIIPLHVESGLTGFGDTTSAGRETILIFPDGRSNFTYHKPTGDGTIYSDVAISVDEALGTITIEGSTVDSYRLKIKWPVAPASVTGVDSWQYDAATRFVTADKTGASFQIVINSVTDGTPPSAPSGLSGVTVSTSRIDLSWIAANDPESGILSYNVYRGGTIVGATTGTTFSDTGLAEDTSYTYRVSAVNRVGLEGTKDGPVTASTLADTSPPGILSVSNVTQTSVSVIFDEPVDQASATNIANYGIDNGVSVLSASLGADLRIVTLNTSSHSEGTSYTLTINNVLDRASLPNAITPNTQVRYSLIDDLIIYRLSVASGKTYAVIEGGLTIGSLAYIDRGYTFSSVPATLAGATYIKTANDDKFRAEENFLSFSINQGVTVYVAYDSRAITLPNWLSGWTDANETLGTTDVSLKLYARDFGAGTVTLGGNFAADASGAESHYVVIVVTNETGSSPVYPTLAGMTSPIRDNDGDGRAEDVNGNGRLDFADVVGFFENLNSSAVQDNPALFDYANNGQVDMADVLELFNMMISA